MFASVLFLNFENETFHTFRWVVCYICICESKWCTWLAEKHDRKRIMFGKEKCIYYCHAIICALPMWQHGEKKIVVLTNQIVDIELTKLFWFPNKFSFFPTNLFVEPTKEFVIAFCITKLFVMRTKNFVEKAKKRLSVLYFSPWGYANNCYTSAKKI